MENKKKLPQGLVAKQELQRQETVNRVLRACANIQEEGRKVTITALVERTGFSRSTFAKSHIRELLVEYGYAFGDNTVARAKCNKTKQSETIAEKDRQIVELRAKNAEIEMECELLRGRLFLMVQHMREDT